MNQGQFDQVLNGLTPQRKEVLIKFLAGETDKEIAVSLYIVEATVRKHIEEICKDFKCEPDEQRSRRPNLIALFRKYKPELVKNYIQPTTNKTEAVEIEDREDLSSFPVSPSKPDLNFVELENAMVNSSLEEEATDSQLESPVQAKIKKTIEEKANISQERLFGVEKYLKYLREYLQDKEGSWFISIVGTGGVGKTSIV
jgi:flagellar biosynthesis GTPase FlhF